MEEKGKKVNEGGVDTVCALHFAIADDNADEKWHVEYHEVM
jgi:hypothetical protein